MPGLEYVNVGAGSRPRRPLLRNTHAGRDRGQVECFADEIAQRYHQLGGLHRPALRQLGGGSGGQAHLVVGAEQDDVGQRCFHRIANAPCTVAAGAPIDRQQQRIVRGIGRGRLAQVAQMARIDVQCAGEGTTEGLVGGDQRAQSLVDLAVLTLAALLHGLHHQQADADAYQGDDGQPEQGGEHGLPGAEV